MPEGYERLRDALKRKGKSDQEAKSMAAAIWNKHHKDNPVTNKHHMEAKLELLHEMGLATRITPGGMLGNTYVRGARPDDSLEHGGLSHKTAYKQKKKAQAISDVGLWPSGKPTFFFDRRPFGVVLLGLPSDFDEAEQILTDKLGRKISKDSLLTPSVDSQVKRALPAPIPKYPTLPNPNPNAPNPPTTLTEILDFLKKQKPMGGGMIGQAS